MKDILEQIYEELNTVDIMDDKLGLRFHPVASRLGKLIRKAIKQAKLEVIESVPTKIAIKENGHKRWPDKIKQWKEDQKELID